MTISAKEETVCPTLNEGLMTKVKSPLKSPLKLPLKTLNKGNPPPFVEAQNPRSRLESTMTFDSLENRSITTHPLTDSAKEVADDNPIDEKTDPFLRNKASHTLMEQPMSLDSKEAIAANSNAKRRGSRKSRSLRSTHLAMMSRPLVTSMISGDDEMLDKSSSSESSLLGKIFTMWTVIDVTKKTPYSVFILSEQEVKFIYSEKATKFCQISTLLLTGTT